MIIDIAKLETLSILELESAIEQSSSELELLNYQENLFDCLALANLEQVLPNRLITVTKAKIIYAVFHEIFTNYSRDYYLKFDKRKHSRPLIEELTDIFTTLGKRYNFCISTKG